MGIGRVETRNEPADQAACEHESDPERRPTFHDRGGQHRGPQGLCERRTIRVAAAGVFRQRLEQDLLLGRRKRRGRAFR